MGNHSWILSQLPKNLSHVTEIGSGDGHLLSLIAKKFPSAKITAYDLAPRPTNLPESILWHRGDIFDQPPSTEGGILIANLFLHHFTNDELTELSEWIRHFDILIFNEPLRSKIPLFFGKLAHPFIHPITRHDMRVSIEAGFISEELSPILQLDKHGFEITESAMGRGSLRFKAQKKQNK